MITGSKRQALSAAELTEALTRVTTTLRTTGSPEEPFGSPTRIEEAHLLHAFATLLTEVGVHLRAREIVSEGQIEALTKPTQKLAAVLAGPDVECSCRHTGPGDHRSDGCNWAHDESGVGCACTHRSGAAPIATRIWLETQRPVRGPF